MYLCKPINTRVCNILPLFLLQGSLASGHEPINELDTNLEIAT